MPAPPDLFALPITDQSLQNLQQSVDLFYSGQKCDDFGEHPVMHETNPQTVASLLVIYLRLMPHPVIPPAFYWTFMRMANISSILDRAAQLRIVIHKLPGASRDLLLALLEYMSYSELPCDLLANVFSNLLIRPSLELSADPPSALCATLLHTLVNNSAFFAFKQDSPNIPPTSPSSNAANYNLEAIAMFDYAGSSLFLTLITIKATNDTCISLKKNDKVLLISAPSIEWLQAKIGEKVGFIPIAYVDLVIVSQPQKQAGPAIPAAFKTFAQRTPSTLLANSPNTQVTQQPAQSVTSQNQQPQPQPAQNPVVPPTHRPLPNPQPSGPQKQLPTPPVKPQPNPGQPIQTALVNQPSPICSPSADPGVTNTQVLQPLPGRSESANSFKVLHFFLRY